MKTVNSIEVVSVENGVDKAGVKLQKVGFTEVLLGSDGKRKFNPSKPRFEVIFDKRTLADGGVIEASPMFGKLNTGTEVAGTIETLDTTEYQPEGYAKPQSKLTIVCFYGENPLGKAALRLREYGAGPIDPTSGEAIILPAKVTVA